MYARLMLRMRRTGIKVNMSTVRVTGQIIPFIVSAAHGLLFVNEPCPVVLGGHARSNRPFRGRPLLPEQPSGIRDSRRIAPRSGHGVA